MSVKLQFALFTVLMQHTAIAEESRARSHRQSFPPNSLPKLHAVQSFVINFHGIIIVSQYRQTVKTF